MNAARDTEANEERASLSGALETEARPRGPAARLLWLTRWPSPWCNVPTLVAALFALLFLSLYSSTNKKLVIQDGGDKPVPLPGCTPPQAGPEYIVVPTAAVATDETRCSVVGRDVLADGGSVMDAAVASALCLGVVHMHSSGTGGGCFILVFNASTGAAEVIDAREEAPAAANQTMFVGRPSASVTGGLAVAVPSELKGLRLAWERHGRLPWSRLVLPAAALADGFVVEAQLALAIASNVNDIAKNRALAAMLMPNGVALQAGATVANPALAAFLRRVAAVGPDAALYRNATAAAALAAEVRAAGGVLTAADLMSYAPVLRDPLRSSALGMTILGVPPPSSGGAAVALIAAFMAAYPTPMAGSGGLGAYRLVEGFKHAFAARMGLGDPFDPYCAATSAAEVADMLSAAWAAALVANTSDSAAQQPAAYGGRWNPLPGGGGYVPTDHGTTHLSVVDGARNAVALTSTINTGFGAKVLSPSTGMLLNDEMDDFSSPGQPNAYNLAPSRANFILPGKRPLSSMSPTIVLDGATGALRMVLGASGGPRIITATANVLLNILSVGLDPGAGASLLRQSGAVCMCFTPTTLAHSRARRAPARAAPAQRGVRRELHGAQWAVHRSACSRPRRAARARRHREPHHRSQRCGAAGGSRPG